MPFLGSIPSIEGTSSGEGRNSHIASSIGCTPLFLSALPQKTGTILHSIVAFLITAMSSSLVISCFSKYFSKSLSSSVTIFSSIFSLHSIALSAISAGISSIKTFSPKSPLKLTNFIVSKSIIPLKSLSVPTGI